MATQVFINLPVRDVARSIAYFTGLGFTNQPKFTDENAACFQVDETIYLMLLTREYFASFYDKPVADPQEAAGVYVALTRETRDAVDELAATAVAAGGTEAREAIDMGFMYQRSVADPDGNIFEFFWMDPAAIEAGPPDMAA